MQKYQRIYKELLNTFIWWWNTSDKNTEIETSQSMPLYKILIFKTCKSITDLKFKVHFKILLWGVFFPSNHQAVPRYKQGRLQFSWILPQLQIPQVKVKGLVL